MLVETAFFDDSVEELPAAAIFHYKMQKFVVFVGFVKFHDVRMVQMLENSQLQHQAFLIGFQLILRDRFYCEFSF